MRRRCLRRLLIGLCVSPMFAGTGEAADDRADAETVGAPARAEQGPLIQGKPVEFWIQALQDKIAESRANAADVLGRAGPSARRALPAVRDALGDPDYQVRNAAYRALLQLDPGAQATLGVFLTEAKDSEPQVRADGVFRLSRIAEAQPDVVMAALAEALHDKARIVRCLAALWLGDIGPRAAPAVPALIEALSDEQGEVRQHAADALGEIGPAASAAVLPLCYALRDDNEGVRLAAFQAVKDIGGDLSGGTPALLNNLGYSEPDTRFFSSLLLARTKAATAAIPPLCDVLLHGEETHWYTRRSCAAKCLGDIGPDAKAAVPALLLAMKDGSEDVRKAAADALQKIDRETADHVLGPR